jgi:hypothetical protein
VLASASLIIDRFGHARRELLLVLNGPKRVQDDGAHSRVFGHIEEDGLRAFVRRIAAGILPDLTVVVTTRLVTTSMLNGKVPSTVVAVSDGRREISDAICVSFRSCIS